MALISVSVQINRRMNPVKLRFSREGNLELRKLYGPDDTPPATKDSWAVTPALPPGLSLEEGVIRGIPTKLTPSQTYRISGGNGPDGTAVGTVTLVVAAQPVPAVEFGMNVNNNFNYERAIPFADLMARGQEWAYVVGGITTVATSLPPLIEWGLLGEGNPNMSLATIATVGSRVFNNMDGKMPNGTAGSPYVLVWKGTGDVDLIGQAGLAEISSVTRRKEYTLSAATAADAIFEIHITSSDSSNPVRDIHCWMPGLSAAGRPIFNPVWLSLMNDGNFSIIRLMDWSCVNFHGAGPSNWWSFQHTLDGRPRPSNPSQGTHRGVCIEYMVALANTMSTNFVLNVPHPAQMSDSDYAVLITDIFDRAKNGSPAISGINGASGSEVAFSGLRSDLTMYVERSNEMFFGFPVVSWDHARMWEMGGPPAGWPIARWRGLVIGELMDAADAVFGADSTQIKHYIGGQTNNPDYNFFMFRFMTGTYRPTLRIDAIGGAGYINPTRTGSADDWDASTTGLSMCEALITDTVGFYRNSWEVYRQEVVEKWWNTDGTHPEFMMYEGGQHMTTVSTDTWDGQPAQNIERMYDVYRTIASIAQVELVDRLIFFSFMSDQTSPGDPQTAWFGCFDNMSETLTLPVTGYTSGERAKAQAIYQGP